MSGRRDTNNVASAAHNPRSLEFRTPASVDARWSVHKKHHRSNPRQHYQETRLLDTSLNHNNPTHDGKEQRHQDPQSTSVELFGKVIDRRKGNSKVLGKDEFEKRLAYANSQIRCRKLELKMHRHEIEVSGLFGFVRKESLDAGHL